MSRKLVRGIRRLAGREGAYRAVFESPRGQDVLADLAAFCHATKPTHVCGDPMETAFNEGKRRVWLRLRSYLDMTDAQIAFLVQQESQIDD